MPYVPNISNCSMADCSNTFMEPPPIYVHSIKIRDSFDYQSSDEISEFVFDDFLSQEWHQNLEWSRSQLLSAGLLSNSCTNETYSKLNVYSVSFSNQKFFSCQGKSFQ